MSTLPERILSRLFTLRSIRNCDGDIYLQRWIVFRAGKDGEGFGINIHKFLRSDEDRAVHCHPWAWLVVPLWRGYIEHTEERRYSRPERIPLGGWDAGGARPDYIIPSQRRVLPFLGIRFRAATYRHRVELIDGKPAWSLFFRFKRTRVWGFWPAEGFIPFNQWWSKHCE